MDKLKNLAKAVKDRLLANNGELLKKALLNGAVAAALSLDGYMRGSRDRWKQEWKRVKSCYDNDLDNVYLDSRGKPMIFVPYRPEDKDHK